MNSMVHVLKPGQCSFDEDQTRFTMIKDCTPYDYPFTLFPWCPRKQDSWGQHGTHLGPVGPRWAHVSPMNLAIRGSCTHSWMCSPRITQTVTHPYLQTYKVNRDFSMKVPDSKVHGANMGPICDRQDPGGPHVGPMNLAIWGGMGLRATLYHMAMSP